MLKPYHILNVRYEPPNSKNIDKYIDTNKDNYKIKLPRCLKMYPSNTTGIVNVYKEYDTNFGKAELLVNIKKIKGDADVFIKRFDKDWNFVENDAINTQPLVKGINKIGSNKKIIFQSDLQFFHNQIYFFLLHQIFLQLDSFLIVVF